MKIRTGFVSNSSSSSFVAWGVHLDYDEMTALLDLDVDIDADEDFDDYYGTVWGFAERLDLDCDIGEDENDVYIGKFWNRIKDNETGAQFKQSVKEKLESVGITKDLEYIDFVNTCGGGRDFG
jgi:hypothetical protein